VNHQLSVASCQLPVVRGQRSVVVSGQWSVVSGDPGLDPGLNYFGHFGPRIGRSRALRIGPKPYKR
jgi:hypothetical protein